MKTLVKKIGQDFKILNLTDTQLSDEEWAVVEALFTSREGYLPGHP
jgi:hypothetical protein